MAQVFLEIKYIYSLFETYWILLFLLVFFPFNKIKIKSFGQTKSYWKILPPKKFQVFLFFCFLKNY